MEWRMGAEARAGAAACMAVIATARDGERECESYGPKRYPLRHLQIL
jgi:hypothetical protein